MHPFELEHRLLSLVARSPKPSDSLRWALGLDSLAFFDLTGNLIRSGLLSRTGGASPGPELGITSDGLQVLGLVGESLEPGLETVELVALAVLAVRPTSIRDLGRSLDLSAMDSIALVSGLAARGLLIIGAQNHRGQRNCFVTDLGREAVKLATKRDAA